MNNNIMQIISKRIDNKESLTLGSFLDLLVSEELSIIKIQKNNTLNPSNTANKLNERDIITTFLPDQIIKMISTKRDGTQKSEGTMIGYFSRLSNGDDTRDEIAREILSEFIIHPFETINLFLSHICNVFYDINTYVDYKSLACFLKCIIDETKYLPGKKGFFGNLHDDFSSSVKRLLLHKQYLSLLTNIILTIIIGSVTDKTKHIGERPTLTKKLRHEHFSNQLKLLLFFIWLPENELTQKAIDFSILKNLSDYKNYIRYSYSVYLFQRSKPEYYSKLIKSIKNETSSEVIDSSWMSLLYSKYILSLPSQEHIDIAEAKLYDIINHNSSVEPSKIETDLIFQACSLLNDIYHEKYGYKTSNLNQTNKRRVIVDRILSSEHKGPQNSNTISNKKQRSNVREIERVKHYNNVNHCLVNCNDSLIAKAFLNDLADYQVFDYYNEASVNEAVSALIWKKKKCIFAFLSENENKNLSDCLTILDQLYNLSFASQEIAQIISSNIDVFVSGNYQHLTSMIDASLSDMGNQCYIKVHICDYNKDCAQKLIVDAPLFIPCLKEGCIETQVNLVVLGNSSFVKSLLVEVIGSCCFPVTPSVTVIGEKAAEEKQRFLQECPGVYKAPNEIERIVPEFLSCSLFTEDIESLLEKYDSENPLSVAMNKGNYFIVDIGSDAENIYFATSLRRWLLRNDSYMNNLPFIAVKCCDSENAYLVSRLAINNKPSNNQIYNNFDLFCFGMASELYSFNNLVNSISEKRALAIHSAYYDNTSPIDTVLNSYYSFSYNRDSSKASVLSMIYILFSLGFIQTPAELVEFCHNSSQLAERYNDWIKQKENLEWASSLEHGRWVGFMLSRGWMPLSPQQVDVYTQSINTGDHKHLLAKIHPFICNWDSFTDDSSQTSIYYELKKRINGLETPRTSTYRIMENYSSIISAKIIIKASTSNTIER